MTSSKVVAWEKPVVRGRNGNPDQIPSARSGHSLTMIGSTGFLFGGVASEIPLGDLHVLHLGKTEATWSKTDVKGPMARWKHSACVVNETQIVVFGGHHSPNLRLNDVWVFDSVTMEWSQPYVPETPGFRSTDDEYHVPSENRAPSARGGHTATPVGNGMWVFGGYGGHGYARRDHDDLHRLDTETWEWSRIEPRGRGPQKRCGHQAVAIDTTLFVWGGWNVSTQFDDIFVLDIPRDDEDQQQPMWSECDRGAMLREPCWNSSSCAVAAVPSWKIFVFGGTNGPLDEEEKGGTLGTLNGELSVLDTGTMVWKTGLVDAAARRDDTVVHSCSARSDATLAFDVKSSRLVLFGGWCKEWLGDLHTLDVASFVGPPYTITGINPTTGPITGGTAVEITGYDFFDSGDRITVRFATIHSFSSKSLYTGARKRNRRHVHKDGEDGRSTRYVNETQINCVTPDFSEHGPGEVRVRIALGLDGFTATSQLFTFYSVAHAKHCLVYGPGVLSGGLSGEETTFYIQARDKDNTNRTTGGDEFTVVVKKMGGAGNGNNELLINGVDVFDNEDGTYEVTYLPPSPGKYSVFVKFLGTHRGVQGRVRGSENLIEFHELAPRSNNLIGGKLVESALEYDFELISDLVDKIEAGLRSPPFNEQFSDVQNTNALIWVKKHLNLLYEKREELEFAMDRIECTLATLDANGVPVDAWRRKLRAQRNKFESCLRVVAPKVAVEISPLLEVQADTTRAEIEEYQRRVQTFLDQKVREGPYTKYDTGFARAKEALEETCSEYQAERSRCKEMVQLAELFDCFEDAKASVDIIDFSGKMLQGFTDLWDCVHSCESYVEEVSGLEWNNVDPKSLGENAKQLLRQIRRSDTIVKRSDVYECLEANIEDFLAACPYVIGLKQPTIKPRHWQELRSITSASRTLTEGRLKLRDVLDLKLHLHAKEINHLIEKATREAGQEETLRVIEKFWRSATFNRHHLSVDKVVLGISGDCAERLQSDQLALQALLVSPFEFSKNEAAIWKTTLDAVDEALGLIGDVQVGWARLFPFFGRNQSVAVELPDETERFSKLDEQIREMFHALAKSKTLLALTTDSMLIPRLNDLLRCLDGGRRSLSDYLLGKRRQFPRFYFLSERTLLEILAATHPQSVGFARHVPDIFLATASFKVIDDGDVPVAMEFSSVVGEESVKFDRAIQLGGRVEEFLQTLFKAQACAIRKRLQSSYTRYPNQLRTQWMHERISKTSINVDPAQVALLVIGMVFVKSVEDAMACGESHALLEYSERHQGDLDDLLLSLRTSLTKGERIRLTSIVCQDTHARDVLKRLLAAAKNETSDTFTWKSQIKWRLSTKQEEDVPTVIVDVCDAVIDYQFEYLGNSPHLVITPVTERCFVAVAFALHTNSGSAIVGPSSGKTSTVIALAAAFGRLCFQFNCASELDYRHAANLLKGLAMSGSWILLEKFDAIATGVASVCITLFEQIRRGWLRHEIGNGSTSVDFDGENIYVNSVGACFVVYILSGAARPGTLA